jgi:molecular chaperone DnaJ
VPVLNGRGRGDQYVTVRVEVPRNLTEQQKEALRAFGQAMGEVPGTTKESAGEEDKGIFHRKKKK